MHSLLDPAVPLITVAMRMRRRWATHERGEFELATGLRRLIRDNMHRGIGYGNFAVYADQELGIPPKMAWLFSSLGRHLERLPLVAEAVRSGRLTYTKAREFMASADPAEQERWIEYATSHTNREIEKEVARTNAEKEGRPYEEKKKVTASFTGEENQTVRAAQEKLMKETKKAFSLEETIPMLAKSYLEGNAAGNTSEDSGGDSADDEPGESAAPPRKVRPYSTLCFCPSCTTTWVPIPGENLHTRVEEWVKNLREGGEFVNLLGDYVREYKGLLFRRDECPAGAESESEGEAATSRYMSVEERKRMDARDGFRCRCPGCTNSLPIEGGHMETPFRDGVPMDATNVGHQCKACNTLIEKGALEVRGTAPFEKYYLKDGTFLGFGYDPKPWNRFPHVGKRSGDGAGPRNTARGDPDRAA